MGARLMAAILSIPCLQFSTIVEAHWYHMPVSLLSLANYFAFVSGPNILRRKEETAYDIVAGTAPINAVSYHLLKNFKDIFEVCSTASSVRVRVVLYLHVKSFRAVR